MTLADVKKEILNDATRKASKIEAEAVAAVKEREQALNERLKAWKKEREAQFKRQAEQLQQRIKAEQEAARNEALLAKRRELIQEVIESAKARLRKESAKHLPKLAKRAQKELDVARIYSREKVPGLTGVEWVKRDIDGLVAENKSGTVSLDLTYDTLLADLQERYVQEINEVLFP